MDFPQLEFFKGCCLNKMTTILKAILSRAFYGEAAFVVRSFLFWLQRSLFYEIRLAIRHYWFSCWLGAEQATSYYLNKGWPRSTTPNGVNSLRPSDAYMRQQTRPSLVQIFGAKPLSEPMMTYCQLNHKEHISMKYYLKFRSFHSRNCIWNCRLWNGGHFVSVSMC